MFFWTQLYSVSRLCPALLDSVLLQALVHRYGFSLTPASLYHLIWLMNYQALGGYSFMHIIESVSCIAAVPKERRDVWQF